MLFYNKEKDSAELINESVNKATRLSDVMINMDNNFKEQYDSLRM